MTKFKVGDVVERTGRASFLWADFAAADAGPYVVTSTTVGGWVQINGYKGWDGYNTHPFEADKFKLVEKDDPLPPAPESGVYYSHNNDRRVTVLLEEGLPKDVIAVGTDASFLKVRLTAETALVLAHDLNRVANEIKRKEKQNA